VILQQITIYTLSNYITMSIMIEFFQRWNIS